MQARPVQGANPDRLDIMAQKSSPSPAARFFGNDDWDAPAEQHTPAPAAGTEDSGLSTAALEESVRPRSLDDFIGAYLRWINTGEKVSDDTGDNE